MKKIGGIEADPVEQNQSYDVSVSEDEGDEYAPIGYLRVGF